MTNIENHKNFCLAQIKKFCQLNNSQEKKLEEFVIAILSNNQNLNLIGDSTISNIWQRHILDCAQLIKYIPNTNLKFADFGSGSGLPGIILSILGLKEIHLIEKSFRKSEFLRKVKSISQQRIFVHNLKLEELSNIQFDCITSRALAPLPKLLEYSIKFLKPEGFCLFLKGKNLQYEIDESNKIFNFEYELYPSITSEESNIFHLKKIFKK